MIVVKISDGLGNQMFQYACGYAVAKRLGKKLVLDASVLDDNPVRRYELNQYRLDTVKVISYKRIPIKEIRRIVRKLNNIRHKNQLTLFSDTNPYIYNSDINEVSDNCYLLGYWQSEKYFLPYREDILEIFTPKHMSSNTKRLAEIIKNQNIISIHVRRGDYLQIECALDMEYYDKAIRKMTEIVSNPVFYVFSDDIPYCKGSFSKYKDVQIVYPDIVMDNPAIEDMYLMSCCRHNIVANSSYSWWGAWLNRNPFKTVICPELRMWTGDFWPDEWIKIKI